MEPKTALDTDKQRTEQEFHDRWAKSIALDDLLVDQSFEACTAMENSYALAELSPVAGKRLFDLGCGAGETSVYMAKQGAVVSALDISPEMVAVGRRLAQKHGVKVEFLTGVAEKLPFPDGHFDLVFGNGVLHHVDLIPALREIKRVLKPGGKAAFIEPLKHNPVIKLYRRLASDNRTPMEFPLGFGDFARIREVFPRLKHKEFWLFSLYIFIHFYVVERASPSKVRYWKKVIEDAPRHERLIAFLRKLDDIALALCPPLGRLCWNTVLVAEKEP
ncbi:MAG TPA: class I SAM-dependent methyltransferase [Elusimicrobiota bacterium]|nr:class I SAM-dependent methyltransferase [Elusimicrobiota bacterium]